MAKLQFNTFGNQAQKKAFQYLLGYPEITEIGYGGAAGGGKSYTGVSWQWMMRNKYPGTRGFFGRQELKRLKQTTLATYFKFLDDYQIPESQRGIYNAQDGCIRFANGSEILLLDLAYLPSDPLYTRFGSLELTDGYIDESAEIDEQCISIIMTRIGRQKNDEYNLPPKLLEGFNPDKGHVYRRYYKPSKEGTLPSYRIFIPALATDNKKLPKSYIEQLKKANEVTKQRLLYGNFEYDDTPGRLFEYDKILSMRTNPKYNGQKYISCDAARKGKDKAVICVWDGFEEIDRIVFDKCTTTEIEQKILELSQKFKVGMDCTIVDEDGVGGGIVDTLECVGFKNGSSPVSPYGAKKVDYLKRNYANLKTQCYFELAKFIRDNKVRVIDDVNFSKLAEELDIIVQIDLDKDGPIKIIPKDEIKDKLGRSPDFSDAIMMRFYFELLKDPETADSGTHKSPNDNVYDEIDIDAWERLLKEESQEQSFDEEGGILDDNLDGDVL